jgi:transcriptional regulator with XRE-family HTH domain
MNLSDRIRNRINELGWNYKVTAEKTGIKYQEVLRLASGSRESPRMDTVVKLIKGLQVDPYYILGIDEDSLVRYDSDPLGNVVGRKFKKRESINE